MWLTDLQKKDTIEFGRDIRLEFVDRFEQLYVVGEVGIIYKVKDVDQRYIWDDVKQEYCLIAYGSQIK